MVEPHWTQAQQDLCWELYNTPGVEIVFWNSDQHGRPCNGGTGGAPPLGVWQDGPPYARPCGAGTYHATTEPHRWAGCRVWVVALRAAVWRGADKLSARGRMVIGEILPEEALTGGVAVRTGRRDLSGADLRGADLRGANFGQADLSEAYFRGADLSGADLSGADLSGADLSGANLRGADLRGASLRGADLRGAILSGASLSGADLGQADLNGARYFVGTVWPGGFDPAAAGAVLVS